MNYTCMPWVWDVYGNIWCWGYEHVYIYVYKYAIKKQLFKSLIEILSYDFIGN